MTESIAAGCKSSDVGRGRGSKYSKSKVVRGGPIVSGGMCEGDVAGRYVHRKAVPRARERGCPEPRPRVSEGRGEHDCRKGEGLLCIRNRRA